MKSLDMFLTHWGGNTLISIRFHSALVLRKWRFEARRFPISKQTFSSDILSLRPLPLAGQMAKTDPEPLPAAHSHSALPRHIWWRDKALRGVETDLAKRAIVFKECAQTFERQSESFIGGTVKDGEKAGPCNCIYRLPCVWLIFFMEDAHEVTMGYKQQMVRFINGEHSPPPLGPLSEHAIL